MDNSLVNRWGSALFAGTCGAVALTAVHEFARRASIDAPRMDVLGERAVAKILESRGEEGLSAPTLHRWALAGDLIGNSIYYSMVACGRKPDVWRRGVALGLAAGAGEQRATPAIHE